MPNESTKWLYEQLTKRGYNVGKDQAEFDNLMASNADSRAWAFETARKSGLNVGKNLNEFTSLVAPTSAIAPTPAPRQQATTPEAPTPTQSAPAPAPQQPQQPAWKPTEQEKARMLNQVEVLKSNVASGRKRFENRMAYARSNFGLRVPAVKIGQNRHVVESAPRYNAKTGQTEKTFITESGNEYGNRVMADMEQNAVDEYKSSLTVEGQLREAEAEKKRIDELMRNRMAEIDKERNSSMGNLLRTLADESHGMPGGIVNSNGLRDYRTDEQFLQLEAAARKNHLLIQTLRDKKNGQMNDFWHAMGTALTNGYTFSDGLSDMDDATALMSAQKHLESINKKRASGQALTKEEEAAEAVLRNASMKRTGAGTLWRRVWCMEPCWQYVCHLA